jgi:AraC-like DNA-binding protein
LFLDNETEISVRQMAAAAGLSTARFSHLFCQCFGMTPREFVAVMM